MRGIINALLVIGLVIALVYIFKPDLLKQFIEPQVVRGRLVEKLDLGKVKDRLKIVLNTVPMNKVYAQEYKTSGFNVKCNGTLIHSIEHSGYAEVSFDFTEGFEYSADSTTGVIYLRRDPVMEVFPKTTNRTDTLIGSQCVRNYVKAEELVEDSNIADQNFQKALGANETMQEVQQRARSQLEFLVKNLSDKNIRFVFRDEPSPSN